MAYKWRVLIAIAFGSYLATMDFSVVNVALPSLSEEFDKSANVVVWAVLAASLVVTGLTLTAGRAGDIYGRRKIYVSGWVIFTIALLFAGFAQNIEQLLATRVVQAVGLSMAMANGNAIVTEAFPDHERGRALGLTGSVVGAGLMSGPVFGGFILGAFDWQAIFLLRVPFSIIAIVMALAFVRESEGAVGEQRRMDISGALAMFVALSSTLLAVNRGQTLGWSSPVILGLFAIGAVTFALFLRIQQRSPAPVISLALFKVRSFAVGVGSLVLNFLGQASAIFLMPFYLIVVRDFSTAKTGLVIASIPAMMLMLSWFSGMISDRRGFRHQTTLGVAIVSIGLFSLSTLESDTATVMIVARLAIIGIGSAIFMSPNSSDVLGSVPRTMLGTASASVATARNVGNATGVALASAILVSVAASTAGTTGVGTRELPPEALLDGIQWAFRIAAAVSTLAIVASFFGRQGEPSDAYRPEEQRPATMHVAEEPTDG
jgi:EmrB/QacA subfamily drug resistance transporter